MSRSPRIIFYDQVRLRSNKNQGLRAFNVTSGALSGGFYLAAQVGSEGGYGQFEYPVPALGFIAPDHAAGDGIEIFDGVITVL